MAQKPSLRGYFGNLARQLMAPARPAAAPPARLEAEGPRNILFLGGSNTVMRHGYASAVIDCLTDRYGPLGRATNFAVGGNSIVHGLMLAKGLPDLDDYDLVIVEYGVNDVKLANGRSMPTWRAAAEGLIRHLLWNRPDRRILFPQFHRRMMHGYQFRPAAELRDLAAYYGQTHRVSALDIDGLLRRVVFPEPAAFSDLYMDGAHFRQPVISRLVGAMVAAEIATPALAEPAAMLPPPVRKWHFQNAELVDFVADRAKAEPVFRNSRFVLPTLRVPVGEQVEIGLPGPLIGVEYVSTATTGVMNAVEGDAEPFALRMRNRKADAKRFPFLLRCDPLGWKQWQKGLPGGARPLRIDATAGDFADSEAVFLSRALCVG